MSAAVVQYESMVTITNRFLSPVIESISTSFAYEYVFSTLPIRDIETFLLPALKSLFLSSCETLRTILLVLFYLILVITKLLILAFPHAMNLLQVVIDFHRTQLSTSDIIIEFSAITILLVILIFRKRILRLWASIESYISVKSKAAAKAAPHVLFFSTALVFAIVGRKFILPLTSSYTMPIFTLVIPWLNTLWMEQKIRQSMDVERKWLERSSELLVLWIVLAIYHGLVTSLSIIPFSMKILSWLPYLKEMVIVILIWVQLSPVFTDIVYRAVISPVMAKLSTYIPTAARSVESHQQRASSMISVLKMMRILNDSHVRVIQAVLQDSVVSVMALVFVFLPNPFSHIGMVCTAMLLPAYRTVNTANMIRNHLHPPSTVSKANQPKVSLEFLQQQANQWINYWICVGFLWLLRIYATTVWPSIMIIITLWLQHTYFSGANKTIEATYASLTQMAERNRHTQEQRRLQRQRQLEEEQKRQEELKANTEVAAVVTEDNPTEEDIRTAPDTSSEAKAADKAVPHQDLKPGKKGDATAPKIHDKVPVLSEPKSAKKVTHKGKKGTAETDKQAPKAPPAAADKDEGKVSSSSDDSDYVKVSEDTPEEISQPLPDSKETLKEADK